MRKKPSAQSATIWTVTVVLSAFCYATEAHAQWVRLNGPDTTATIALASSGQYLFAGSYRKGFSRSTNSGTTWTALNGGLTSTDVYALIVVDTILYAGTYGGGVFRSTNQGNNWSSANNGLVPNNIVWTLARVGSRIFAGTYSGGVFVSNDAGANWTPVNNGLTNVFVNALVSNGTELYAGTWGGGVFRCANPAARLDSVRWTGANAGLTDPYVWSFAASGPNVVVGTDTGGVYLTTNSGTNWSPVNNGLSDSTVYTLLANGSQLVAGTWGDGVYVSADNGTSWSARSRGLDSVGRNTLCLAIQDTNLFVGTSGRGVWRRSLANVLSVGNALGFVPPRFNLEQNFPNPFNPSTTIRYGLPVSGFVTLRIYNTLGQEITTLVAQEMPPGIHDVSWDASAVASGVYFSRLTVGGFLATRKLVFVR